MELSATKQPSITERTNAEWKRAVAQRAKRLARAIENRASDPEKAQRDGNRRRPKPIRREHKHVHGNQRRKHRPRFKRNLRGPRESAPLPERKHLQRDNERSKPRVSHDHAEDQRGNADHCNEQTPREIRHYLNRLPNREDSSGGHPVESDSEVSKSIAG